MTHSDEGPSLTVRRPLIQEGMDHEALKKDIYERVLILQDPRPIIETIKFIDQHKKLLDNVKRKNNPEVFVLPIHLEAKVDSFALADTGSNINVLPYQLYTKLRREDAKPIAKKITMLNYSKAEPMGILRDVLCQIGVTTILAKSLILDMPVDKDVPIVMGRSFLYTCGGIINTIKGTTSTFDGIYHQDFYIATVKSKEEEKYSEDGEEYYVKRDKNGKPFYGPTLMIYLNCDDPLDRPLALQEALNPFKKTVGTHDDEAGSSQLKRSRQHETVEEAMLPHVYHEFLLWGLSNRAAKSRYNANLARLLPKQIYSSVIMDWGVLNNMGCAKEIEAMLEIKVYEFDEVVMDDELMTKKLIKFRLAGRGGLRSNENFNAKDYWLSISSEEELHLSRSLASTIRSPILRVLQKMITYGLCQRTSRELIGPNGKLIAEDPAPGEPRVAMPRGSHPSMQDLYHRMGRMEIRQRTLERMSRRQLYHTDRYAGLFEHMAGHYGYTLQRAYAPPSYDEEDKD
ncbi:retrotransposon ORF1 [Tanacetum coccineum]|uniref:Retrotransposon ORF1 n=1 Tax=Tanacetum coccineum TaxID=301880 RepID=A0ABQ5AUS4_9ASTR